MSGLRERQKEQRRRMLLEVSARRFRDGGFEGTTMQDIAAGAEVSLPTVYKYFPSKRSLLAAMLQANRELRREALDRVVATLSDDVIGDLGRLLHEDFVGFDEPADKALWREILAAIVQSDDRGGDEFAANRAAFKHYLRLAFAHHIAGGRLLGELDLELLVDTVYALVWMNYRTMVSDESATCEAMVALTCRQVALILRGWHAPH